MQPGVVVKKCLNYRRKCIYAYVCMCLCVQLIYFVAMREITKLGNIIKKKQIKLYKKENNAYKVCLINKWFNLKLI